MRRIASDSFAALTCLMFVTFLSVYGGNTGLIGGFKGAVKLLTQTFEGKNLTANYWGVTATELVNSFQLIIVSVVLTLLITATLVTLNIILLRRNGRGLLDGVVTLFESIPDAMFVVIFAVLSLILFDHFGIDISVFSETHHPSVWQTMAPASALSIPAALYIRRILILRYEDEVNGMYVITAWSKGCSNARIFFKHILPNLGTSFSN